MTEGSHIFGIICIVVSVLVIVTIITGAQVLHKTKRDFQDSEVERAGQRMALSCRYQADGQQEWMQEDVEVIPEMRMPLSHPQEIQMANLGEMQMPVSLKIDVNPERSICLFTDHVGTLWWMG